jgi:hypothetical protein
VCRRELEPLADKVWTDPAGNLVGLSAENQDPTPRARGGDGDGFDGLTASGVSERIVWGGIRVLTHGL